MNTEKVACDFVDWLVEHEYLDFEEGLAAVNKGGSFLRDSGDVWFSGGEWGYINRSGEGVLPFQYDEAGSFYGGAAFVRIAKNFFYIDKYGNEL